MGRGNFLPADRHLKEWQMFYVSFPDWDTDDAEQFE